MISINSILGAPARFFRFLYKWTMHWAKTPQAPYALFWIAFIESSFFIIPPDVLLIPMVASSGKKWLRFASICTAGSVAGAFLGYFIGWSLYETVGRLIVSTYNLQGAMDIIGQKYAENAFLTVFTAAFTPIPYKVITIAAGLFRIPLVTLTVASVVGRGARFFLVAGVLRIFGERIERTVEKYFDIFSIVFVLLLVGGFIIIKYLR